MADSSDADSVVVHFGGNGVGSDKEDREKLKSNDAMEKNKIYNEDCLVTMRKMEDNRF